MRILITGGNGYIGNSLYNGLKQFYDVKKISRNDLDLTDSRQVNDFFDKGCYDIIIHCAVKGGSRLKEDEWDIIDNNLKMYYNLSSNKHCFNKFIHFGSGAEIYSQNTPYGLSKHLIRQSLLRKPNSYNLRIFAVFDENELDTRFIKSNIKRYINKESMIIHQNRYMDFFYMKDLISLVDYYIKNDNPPKEINCTYSDINSLESITNLINNLDTYKVDIIKEKTELTTEYCGKNEFDEVVKYEGLENALKIVYNKIKQKI